MDNGVGTSDSHVIINHERFWSCHCSKTHPIPDCFSIYHYSHLMFWKLMVLRRFYKSHEGNRTQAYWMPDTIFFPTIIIGAFSKYCKCQNPEIDSMNIWRSLYELKANRTISALWGVTSWIVTEKGERKWKYSVGKRNDNICVNTGYITGLLKFGMYFKVAVNKRVSVC